MDEMPTRIREFRKLRGWSAERLAQALGTTQATISRLELGKSAVTVDWIYKIAFVLGVKPGDLLVSDGRSNYAFVQGDLRRRLVAPNPLFSPDDVYPILIPTAYDTRGGAGALEAFETAEHGWIIVIRILKLTIREWIGRTFVLLIDPGGGNQELAICKLEDSSTGPGFSREAADPADRWLRISDKRINRMWMAIAEYRSLGGQEE